MNIQDDVPIPNPAGKSYNIAPTVRRLELNQSFALPLAHRKSLRYSIWYVKTDPEHEHKQFATRTVEEDGIKVVRCWRLK